jgi:uncharacterized membrane protein YvbJ
VALISCPECGHQVSDQASACPSCAYPIRSTSAVKAGDTQKTEPQSPVGVQTIEQTGKKFKAMQAFGCLGIIIGIMIIWGTGSQGWSFGAILAIAAGIFLLAGTLGGWWHHG